jgi:hypothetical protein
MVTPVDRPASVVRGVDRSLDVCFFEGTFAARPPLWRPGLGDGNGRVKASKVVREIGSDAEGHDVSLN